MALTVFAKLPTLAELAFLIVAYVILGWDVVWQAVKNITRGQVFDEHFLMSVSTIGAFAIGEYPEAVAVMLFYQVGEFFQSLAVKRSRKSISDLMDICPDSATVKRNGAMSVVLPMAANDLLTINGVDASFVAIAKNGGVNISARSMGALNVQVILEPLGGGGHLTMAGAQLRDCTVKEAEARIRAQIDEYRANQECQEELVGAV